MTWELRENGSLCFDGMVVGKVEEDAAVVLDGAKVGPRPRITLNLGWCKAAGAAVTVHGDPEVDRKRGGIVLERD